MEPMGFRLTPEARQLIKQLEIALGLRRSGVVEQAVRQLAIRHGVQEPRKEKAKQPA